MEFWSTAPLTKVSVQVVQYEVDAASSRRGDHTCALQDDDLASPAAPAALEAHAEGDVINIFSIASGHMYERLQKIMMLSVLRHTHAKVKFWCAPLSSKQRHVLQTGGFDALAASNHTVVARPGIAKSIF